MKDLKMKKIIWLIGFVLFVGMAIVGVKFIFQAEQSASKIGQAVPSKQIHRIQNISLSPDVVDNSMVNAADDDVALSPSDGSDAQIVRGEFAYRAGLPVVSVMLKNEAKLPIYHVKMNVFLRINGNKTNVAKALGVPVVLPQPLVQGESMRVNVPVSGGTWSAENVAQARSRQMLVQIVSVGMAENEAASDIVIDYPQTSDWVSIRQTVNDWVETSNDNDYPDPDFVDEAVVSNAAEYNTEEDERTQENHNEQVQENNYDAVQQILEEQKLP